MHKDILYYCFCTYMYVVSDTLCSTDMSLTTEVFIS